MHSKQDKTFGIKIMAALLLAMFFIYYVFSSDQDQDEVVVRDHLQAIKDNRLTEAYYRYTSKDFQSTLTLADFKKFLLKAPGLMQLDKVEVISKDPLGKVQAHLKSDQEELKVDFTMQKQDNEWKVHKIEVMNKGDLPEFDSSIFKEPIKHHIKALREKNLEKAYLVYTASAFRESTSLSDFKAFVKDFAVFSEKGKVDFKRLSFNNNIGTYEILMTSRGGVVYELKYDLISENGIWKILQIQITETAEED